MKAYVDLHLIPPGGKTERAKELIKRAAELGYNYIGLTIPMETERATINQLRRFSSSEGVDMVTRVDLTPKNSRELLEHLRRLRRRYEIIAVRCTGKAVARQAAKDRRVDILSFPSTNPKERFFDRAEAELASKASAALEIDLTQILLTRGARRIRLLSTLRTEASIAERLKVPIVLSSGATGIGQQRRPRDMASLSYLFDMKPETALKAISENPLDIIERNRRKLSPDYVAPGVYIIRRGRGDP